MKSISALAVLSIATLASPDAEAELVRWSFEAVVQDFNGSASDVAAFGVTQGTVITGTYLIDTSITGVNAGNNLFFDGSVIGFTLNAGDFNASFDAMEPLFNSVGTRNDTFDAVVVSASMILEGTAGNMGGLASLEMFDSDGDIVDDDSFPTLPSLAELDPYNGGRTNFVLSVNPNGEFTSVFAEITMLNATVVPLPASVLLMVGALSGLGLFRKR
ncbi:MAG: VPLPA-CTERM sorting domain-containing protein [Pseudomonadota bacterium]